MPRPTGLSSAASALRYWERRQEVAANNLANVSTDGFKGQRVFATMLNDQTTVAGATTDFIGGTMRETRSPLDVAIKGDAFLVVDTPNGERFTRGGTLQVDVSHRLVDASGHPLLGEHGDITLPHDGAVDIGADGTVTLDGKLIDRLRMERPAKGAELAHEGGTLFVPDPGRTVVAPGEITLKQGFVEDSNVSTVGSMVDMIAVQRAYASVQKAVTTLDSVRGTAVTELGKPV